MPRKRSKATADAPPLHYLRQWREYRKLSQEALGALAKTSGSVIHLLETFQRKLTAEWAHRLAGPLRTRPGYLYDVDPREPQAAFILDVWRNVRDENKPQAQSILETFQDKSVDEK